MSSAVRLLAVIRRLPASTADADLVRAYAVGRGEEPFRQLVARHGPAVLGQCRRALGDLHAADGAFQAIFLILARNPRAVRKPKALAAWLFGVARRVCAKARLARARRRAAEANAPPRPSGDDPAVALSANELLAALDDELSRLPERDRSPLHLVFWQGLPVAENASAG